MDASNDQYDSPWKEAIERYFPEFMAFYFPDASAEIDWAKEHVFLDQELRAVVQDAEFGTRFVDRLVRVTVLSGDERQWDKQRVIDLFSVVDWLLQLPEWLNSQVLQELETIEESKKVRYVTSVERIGMAKGIAEGRLEGESRLLRRLLERRFGVLPEWASEQLISASEEQLEAWGEALLTAPTLEAFFKQTNL